MSGNINDTKPAQIMREITAMRKELSRNKGESLEYYRGKYSHLSEFPYLIEKVYKGASEADMDKIRTMIVGVSNIQTGKISYDDASVKMGEALAVEYVYPVIGKPDNPMGLAEAKSRVAASMPKSRPEGTIPLKDYLADIQAKGETPNVKQASDDEAGDE